MYACLLLPRFRLQAALRWREAGQAAVVLDENGLVCERNEPAIMRHIEIGMTPPQALARDGGVQILAPALAQEDCLNQILIQAALSLSPDVELTLPGACVADLRHAARNTCWQRLADDQVAALRDHGLEGKVGVASTPDLALLAAQAAKPVGIVYDTSAFAAALPLEALAPSEALRQVVLDWGVERVGDFLKLPRAGLVERLGPEAEILLRKVSGRNKRPLRLVREKPVYAEAFDFDYEVETTEPLLFLLRRFLQDLTARLCDVYRVAGRMVLAIPLDDGSGYERTFRIPAPTAKEEVLFRILQTHLESLQLDQRPVGLRLRLEPACPARDQLQLFESTLRDPNQFGETLAKLQALVGNDCVGVPACRDTHQPDQFTLATEFPLPQQEGEARLGLPLRRYRKRVTGTVRMKRGRPVSLVSAVASDAVRAAHGPYRLSGHWWDRQQWIQEEWDVELEGGGLYRLSRQKGHWEVEGCYDLC